MQALSMKPHVLILDEPTAGLDPGAHKDILSMIEQVHESQNNIILFVSHNMADVAALSDKVLVMDEGKLVMAGTPKEIFAQRQAGWNRTFCTAGDGTDVPAQRKGHSCGRKHSEPQGGDRINI